MLVRVATLNNFNCTKTEWDQLDTIASQNPNDTFFISCNAKTPLLQTINDHPYRAVITINPDLNVDPTLVKKVLSLDPSKIAFVRVKWLPAKNPSARNPRTHRRTWGGLDSIQATISQLRAAGHEVVITAQRFISRKSMTRYTNPAAYKFECSRFRLNTLAWNGLKAFARSAGARICDAKGMGCLECGLCATLNQKPGEKIVAINLSCSGLCPYSCPDCYAKAMVNFRVKIGLKPMSYNVIKANRKQSGQTKHIKNNRKAA